MSSTRSFASAVAKRFALFAASLAVLAALASGTTAFLSGCEQEEGARCQQDDDCDDGLLCNQATQSCARTGGGDIDATVPEIIDSQIEKDDGGIDAAVDAAVDMMPDTM